MITLKTPAEIEAIHHAGRVLAEAHRRVAAQLRPGVTTRELDEIAESHLVAQGAIAVFKGLAGPQPYPAASCLSVNDELTGGIPDRRRLLAGDLVSVDLGCRVDGWCADAAVTYPVGDVNPQDRILLQTGRQVLERAIEAATAGTQWSRIAKLAESVAAEAGFEIVPGCRGHGIGRELQEDPQVPLNATSISAGNDFRLEPGLVFTIEPLLVPAGTRVRRLANGWTTQTTDGRRGAHFEETIAITPEGPRVLTRDDGTVP